MVKREFSGVGLLLLALFLIGLLMTYAIGTDGGLREVRGAFGSIGAAIVAPLVTVFGWSGVVFLPILPAVHGLRLLGRLNRSEDRSWLWFMSGLMLLVPVAFALGLRVGRDTSLVAGVWGGMVAFYLAKLIGYVGAWLAVVAGLSGLTIATLAWNPVLALFDRAPKVAAALELVHTATLLHDDVIDKAPLRRGRPTVNAKWGDDVAILIADYLYSNAFGLAMQSLPPQVLSLVCQVTARMCEGELFQIEKRDTRLTREDYLRIVRGKTAFLFSACAGLGAVLAGAGDDRTEAMTRFGLGFGVAFQISDDSLDMVAPDEDLGKLHGTDIRNGKQTLPLILAYGAAPPADRAALWSAWEAADADRVFALVATHRGVDRALGEARDIVAEAKAKLAGLPEGPDARYLARLADYVVNRNY